MARNREKQRVAQHASYLRNKERILERNREKGRLNRMIAKAIKEEGCADCGGKFPPYVMDFDHRDPSTKLMNPSQYRNFSSTKVFVDELAKCDPVCANCHRIREHSRRQ